jgi:hypothetical protein
MLGRSSRSPRPAWSCLIQLRRASGCTPNCSANLPIAGFEFDSAKAHRALAVRPDTSSEQPQITLLPWPSDHDQETP